MPKTSVTYFGCVTRLPDFGTMRSATGVLKVIMHSLLQ